MHEEPAIACADLKYDILLEKPMAPSAEACCRIVEAVKRNNVLFAVCHVLRYTKYTLKLKELLASGVIGDIVSIQHLEPVGYWHQAHSFVRGNWRNEEESSFMLLAKCCHDIDWLRGVMDKKCVSVHSFGSLRHFRKSEQPAGAADRCSECPHDIESCCPYSAYKIYFRDRLTKGNAGWPLNVLTPEPDKKSLQDAIVNGPYGRCVYACDNDVVDNQVVNLQFEDGSTCSMTMTAFTGHGGRRTRIFGTLGMIENDGTTIVITDFLHDTVQKIDTNIADDGGILSGHGGGDFGLMDCFVRAIAERDSSHILSGTDETLESHLMVFAAEKSRRTGTVIVL
jgi:predicted dehydrogenase